MKPNAHYVLIDSVNRSRGRGPLGPGSGEPCGARRRESCDIRSLPLQATLAMEVWPSLW